MSFLHHSSFVTRFFSILHCERLWMPTKLTHNLRRTHERTFFLELQKYIEVHHKPEAIVNERWKPRHQYRVRWERHNHAVEGEGVDSSDR